MEFTIVITFVIIIPISSLSNSPKMYVIKIIPITDIGMFSSILFFSNIFRVVAFIRIIINIKIYLGIKFLKYILKNSFEIISVNVKNNDEKTYFKSLPKSTYRAVKGK